MPLIPDSLARLLPHFSIPAHRAAMPSIDPGRAGVGVAPALVADAEAKASRTGPLISYESLGAPVWSARDYSAFSREGFMQNAIVYRCVRMIAEAAASIPLLLYEGANERDDHPLLTLLASPSPHQTGTDFLETFIGYLLVSGNSYVEAVALNGELRELYALRPDRMTVLPGLSGWPEGYEYTAAGGTARFTSDVVPGVRPILHMRLFHPLDDHYGLSPIEAAATAIDIHNQASKWNKALLDNAARPSGALVYAAREGRLSPEQFERLKNELQEGFQGAKNAGRPLLLEGGLDWKPLSLTPAELDFINTKHAAAREIALALGVPPMLLGIPGDATFSNYQEANRTFWRNTVIPLMQRSASAISSWLGAAYGGSLTLKLDLDQVQALAPEREALWSLLEKTTFLTAAEKRLVVGYPAETEPGKILKFNPGQPRNPAGSSNGGRWVGSNGTATLIAARKKGGIPKVVYDWAVRKFVSSYCKKSITEVLPSQFNEMKIGDMLDLAKGGNKAARTCKKLLEQPRFRK
ncbi:MAG: phage portal protein [Hyphomicrobiaceae bacterium]